MTPDWDQRLKEAKAQKQAAETKKRELAAYEKKLDDRYAAIEERYTRIATSFALQVIASGMPGARPVTFRVSGRFRSRPHYTSVVIISGTGSGSPASDPSHNRGLAVWENLPPSIISPYLAHVGIPQDVYDEVQSSSERVPGLASMLANLRSRRYPPEPQIEMLLDALARWALRHLPELDLSESI